MTVRTLIIDNYDSFTYNLFSLISEVNGVPPTVVKNDVEWDSINFAIYDNVVISPGPGRPDVEQDFGISSRAILESGLPVLGVCLGHQGLCQLFGARVELAPEPMHGRVSTITHTGVDLFAGVPTPLAIVRYHSLIVRDLPPELEAIAWTDDGLIMGVRHVDRPLWGVQFHPESISSSYGRELMTNFRDLTVSLGDTDGPEAAPTPFIIESVRIDRRLDPEAVYRSMFSTGPNSYWLDGSSAAEPESRFTVMGDCSGPYAEYITYSVAETVVSIHRRGEAVEQVSSTFFDYIDEQLRTRFTAPHHELPFAFGLGYVGYLGYELKADTGGHLVHTSDTADAAMVFSDRAVVFDHEAGCCYILGLGKDPREPELHEWLEETSIALTAMDDMPPDTRDATPIVGDDNESGLRLRHDRAQYIDLIEQCLAEIRSGETYEVCLTNSATIETSIDPFSTYSTLREINPAPYSALLQFTGVAVLSASPERFLRIDADRIVESKPIKGTRPRGHSVEEDDALRADLLANEKDRSENLMIVDLVRNDLARVCIPGSVHVPKLFDVETYAPVHQLVSTVRGRLREDASAVDCVRAAFPGGSMTGAPKIRTMEIIDKLEDGPRGVYSGAIGYFSITGTADFSIVIRTMVATEHQVTFGIGGAIVALSDPTDEFEETIVKAASMRRSINR